MAITPWNHCLNKGIGWELAESSEASTALKECCTYYQSAYAKAGNNGSNLAVQVVVGQIIISSQIGKHGEITQVLLIV